MGFDFATFLEYGEYALAPIIGALVGFLVWFVQSKIESLRKARERLHDDRRKIYLEILEPFIRVFVSIGDPSQAEGATAYVLSYEFRRTSFAFSLIGSDKVVRSFNEMMQFFYRSDDSPDPKELLSLWGDFLLQIRKDVGEPKTKLHNIDMLRGYMKDVDSLFARSPLVATVTSSGMDTPDNLKAPGSDRPA